MVDNPYAEGNTPKHTHATAHDHPPTRRHEGTGATMVDNLYAEGNTPKHTRTTAHDHPPAR